MDHGRKRVATNQPWTRNVNDLDVVEHRIVETSV